MQPYSPQIPWVLVGPYGDDRVCECKVCGALVRTDDMFVDAFAEEHREHRAPEGTLGLGDALARLAKPVASALGMAPCSPCEARRRAMNEIRMRRFW